MSAIHHILIIVFVIAAVLGAGCTQPAAQPPATQQTTAPQQQAPAMPVEKMTVPFAPVPVLSTDGVNIAYELELTPAGDPAAIVPEKIEVINSVTGKVLYTPDAELLAFIYRPADNPLPTAEELKTGTGKVAVPRITLWFKVNPEAVPDRLSHRLTLNRTASGLPPVTITGGDVAVRTDLDPVAIGPPVRGPGWAALETTAPTTHHFHAQITMNGVTRVPQRYAQDWIYLDPVTGQAAKGDASLAKNYLGYGKDIYSVDDGTVVDVLDGLPDVEKIYSAPPATIPTMAGNYVIVDIGNKKYACYAHLLPGSVRVKKGDVVKEGQVLGQMGNSGNSDLPHLHFQVVTGTPSFLGAEGYPHMYRSLDLIGGINQTLAEEMESRPGYDINRVWSEIGSAVRFLPQRVSYNNCLPENGAVVWFA
jgi:hypothetical protein